jgi:hypothetical protein
MRVRGGVPRAAPLAEGPGMFDGAEAVRELRLLRAGLERALRVRVVIRPVWSAMGLGHSRLRQQERDGGDTRFQENPAGKSTGLVQSRSEE